MASGRRLTHEEYVSRIFAQHGNNIAVVGSYVCATEKIEHRCVNGHTWFVVPGDAMRATNCFFCRPQTKLTTAHYVKKLFESDIPFIVLEPYVTSSTKILHECPMGHRWSQTPNNILSKRSGCPRCNVGNRHSKMAVAWLEQEAKRRRIKIEHAANGGEFVIPGTRYRADGFNKRGRIVFEFYGDDFHGNPKKFKPDTRPVSFLLETARELYVETIRREKIIRSLGFTLVTMWESEFRGLTWQNRK